MKNLPLVHLSKDQSEIVTFIEAHHDISWKKTSNAKIVVRNSEGNIVRTIKPRIIDRMLQREIVLLVDNTNSQSLALNQNMCQRLVKI